jgi:hypothetical protein
MNNKGSDGFIKISMIFICISAFTLISAVSASDELYNVYCDWKSDSGGTCCVIMKTTDPRSPALSSQLFKEGVSYSRANSAFINVTRTGDGLDCEYGTITQADNTLWNVYCDQGSNSGGSCCVVKKTTDPRPAALSSQVFPVGTTYRRAMERLTQLTSAGVGGDCQYGTSTQADNTLWNVYCDWETDSGGSCCVVAKTTDPRSAALSSQEFPVGTTYDRAMERLTQLTSAGVGRDCQYGTSTQADDTRWSIFCDMRTVPRIPGLGCCVIMKTTDPPHRYTLIEFPAGVPFNQAMDRLNELSRMRWDYCGKGVAIPPTPTTHVVPTISITPRATATPDSGSNPISIIQAIIGGFIKQLTGQRDNSPPGQGPTQTVVPTTHATLKKITVPTTRATLKTTAVPTTTPTIKRTVVPTITPTPCKSDDATCEYYRKLWEEYSRKQKENEGKDLIKRIP